MKILFISDHLIGNSGWSRYARDLVLESKKNGANVLCLVNVADPKTDAEQKEVLKKDPSAYVSNPILSFVNAMKINKNIRSFDPDIIHIIVEPYSTMLPFMIKGRAKIVLTVHSTFAYMPILVNGIKKKISEYITKLSLKKVDAIISVSKFTEDHLIKHLNIINAQRFAEDKLHIVSGGVASVTRDWSKAINQPREILFVGAVKPRKGLLEAVEALSKVKSDFVYRIVGKFNESSEYVKLIRKKLAEYNLTNKVFLVGTVSDQELENMYKKADLYLMLSTNNGADFEGYGLVYLEANAWGVPVIGPNDSGVSDAVVSGKTGYLVNQHDSVATARVIDEVLENNSIKADDCVEWARQNTSENKAKRVFSIYAKLIGE